MRQSFSILARTWISTRAHDCIFNVYFCPPTTEQVLQPPAVPVIPQVRVSHRVPTWGPLTGTLPEDQMGPLSHMLWILLAIRGKGAPCTEPHLGECGVPNLGENLYSPTDAGCGQVRLYLVKFPDPTFF